VSLCFLVTRFISITSLKGPVFVLVEHDDPTVRATVGKS
jgi:hypothetical protein